MRYSLKLLMLISILCSVVAVWARYRSESSAMEIQIAGNTDWHTEYIPEKNGRSSSIAVNLNGEVQSARLAGPAGYAALKSRPDACRQLWGLSFKSMDAFTLFDAREFPNLESLTVADLEWSAVSLSQIGSTGQLNRLSINALSADPSAAIATIPTMPEPIQLNIRSDSIARFDEFPQLDSVSTLVLHAANADDDAVEQLRACLPGCRVVVVRDSVP